jgi:hypothetical protein
VTQFREAGVSASPFFDKWQFFFFLSDRETNQDMPDAVPLAALRRDKSHE